MKKRDALIISDLHFRTLHLEEVMKLLSFVIETIILRQPTYLFILGDVFHYKDKLSGICIYFFKKFIKQVLELSPDIQIIVLVGNHDWCKPYTVHSLESIKEIKNVVVVDDIYRLDDENIFISYCRERERFDKLMKELGPGSRLFGHLDINSFKVGSGWEEYQTFCDPELFSQMKLKQVFSGHLHLAQQKVVNDTEIVFVGTGYTTDFGETDQEKRILLLDLNSGKYESISTHLTLHKTLKMKATDPFPIIPEEDIKNGVKYRVIVQGTKEQISTLIKPKNYLATIIPDFLGNEAARIDLSVTDTQEQIFEKYIKEENNRSFGGEASGYDLARLNQIGRQYMNKAKK